MTAATRPRLTAAGARCCGERPTVVLNGVDRWSGCSTTARRRWRWDEGTESVTRVTA